MFAALPLALAVVVGARQAPSAPSVPWMMQESKNPKLSNDTIYFPRGEGAPALYGNNCRAAPWKPAAQSVHRIVANAEAVQEYS